jgi:phage recombination protein Bet
MELIQPKRINGSDLITEAEAKLTLEDVETIKNAIFKGCEESELKLFLHDCQRQGVHPLDRLIHPTVRKDKNGNRTYTPITSIDLFRARAEDSGCYAGNDEPVFSGDPKTEAFQATVTVYKIVQGVRCAFTATARWTEYKPDSANNKDFMWQNKPHVMLGKCAEALALRKAFPRQLGRLYVKEEMEQAEQPIQQEEPKPKGKVTIPPSEKLNVRKLKPEESKLHPPDEDRVPTEVTDASVVSAEPIVVPDDGLEAVVLKAYSKEKTDKKGNAYRGVLLVHADNSEKWWNCYHAETIAGLQSMKGQPINAKLEMKGEYPLCHKLEVMR